MGQAKRQTASEKEARRARVASLLLERTSIRDIAELVGVPRSTIGRDAVSLREEWRHERIAAVDRAGDEELQRINALERAYWRLAVEPAASTLDLNLQAFDRILKLMKRRAELLGLDAPKRIDITARIREMAKEAGLSDEDAESAVREALAIVREAT